MKIEYILVLKDQTNQDTRKIKPKIQHILKKCFNNAGTSSFEVKYKQTDFVINYDCATHTTSNDGSESAIYYLTFWHGTSKNEIAATALDVAHTCFTSKINTGESKFHVTISYDERALYFCSRAYPHFSEFESKLRCLILKLLTQTFGMLWAKKTLAEEQVIMLKEKMHGANFEKIASEALYEMDFSVLESYLFKKTRDISTEDIVDNYLNPASLRELNIEKVSELLDSARPKSNWERYFADKITISQLEEKLSVIRLERNKVAHTKHYTKRDFDEDKQLLIGFCVKLDEAIHSIGINNLSVENGLDAILKFGSLLSDLSLIRAS